jgi:hypothetical protein
VIDTTVINALKAGKLTAAAIARTVAQPVQAVSAALVQLAVLKIVRGRYDTDEQTVYYRLSR